MGRTGARSDRSSDLCLTVVRRETAKVDKYGRKIKQKKGDDLKKYYRLSKEEEKEAKKKQEAAEPELDAESSGAEGKDLDDEDEEAPRQWDFARGEGPMCSSSEEEDEDQEAEASDSASEASFGGADDLIAAEEDDIYDRIGPFATEDIPTGDETHRLALVNMDWDNVRAKDIFKVFLSFAPKDGKIISVKVYPSEFGKERIAHEAIHGPPAEIFGGAEDDDDEDAGKDSKSKKSKSKSTLEDLIKADSGEEFDNERLRLYQLERLRYYYAIIDCDSIATARAIYEACDGAEFEKTSNFIDLRYVPDEETFDDEPSDAAYESPTGYKPLEFVTKALQHSKVELTWDQDPIERTKTTRRKFTKDDLAEMDFQAYLGSDSESEEDEEKRKKYRELLLGGNEQEDEAEEMEITFTPGLEGKIQDLVDEKLGKTDEKSKKKNAKEGKGVKKDVVVDEEAPDENGEPDLGFDDPFFLEAEDPKLAKKRSKEQKKKKHERKEPDEEEKRTRAELELLMADETGQHSKHFDMKDVLKQEKKKKKKKSKDRGTQQAQDEFEVDVSDPRFASMFSSSAFAIDTTSAQFKDTSNMRKLLSVRKSGSSGGTKGATAPAEAKAGDDMAALVANVKRKATMSNGADAVGNKPAKKRKGNAG